MGAVTIKSEGGIGSDFPVKRERDDGSGFTGVPAGAGLTINTRGLDGSGIQHVALHRAV